MNEKTGGLGLCGTVGVVFIVLKLVGVIDWSWWWVLAPIWIPTAIVIVALIVTFFVCLIRNKKSGGC